MGSHSQVYPVGGLNDGQWNDVLITPGVDSWWENFNEDQLDVGFEWDGAAGTVKVDDVSFCEFSPWGPLWYAIWGSDVPFLAAQANLPDGDRFSMVDIGIDPTAAKIAWHLARAGLVLPDDPAPSILDP